MLIDDLKRILRNVLGFSIGTLLTQAIGFFLLPIYTRYLTPADYGIISIASVLLSLLSIIFFLGMRDALNRYYFQYRNTDEYHEYIGSIVLFVISLSLILTILLTLFGAGVFTVALPNIPFYPYVVVILWTAFFSIPMNVTYGLLQVQERSFTYGLLSVIQFITNAALIVYFIAVLREGALGSLKGQLICSVSFAVVGLLFLRTSMVFRFNPHKVWESLTYGLALLPHELSGWTSSLLNRLILNNYTTLAAVGLYSLGYQIGSIMSIVASSINFAWVPFFMSTATEQGEDANPRFAALTVYYMSALLFVGLAISLYAIDILRIMTTPDYYGAAAIVPIIVGTYIFDGLYYQWVVKIFYAKKTGYLSIVTFTAAVLNVVLNFILIPVIGMFGAAFAMLISFAYTFILVFIIANRLYPISYDYSKMIRISLAFLVLFIVGLILPSYDLILDLVMKSGILLVYVGVLVALGVFSRDEIVAGIRSVKLRIQR